jgi:ribosomal protein L29
MKYKKHVRGKSIDQFETYISSAKKHALLGSKENLICQQLDELRKIRNIVYIQNFGNVFEPKDVITFSQERQNLLK